MIRFLFTCAALLCAGPRFAQDEATSVDLDVVKFAKDIYRLSPSLTRVVKSAENKLRKAYAAEIGGRRVLFFDVDKDRKLTGEDGFALEGLPFVVPLPEELLLGTGQFSYRFEGTHRIVLLRSDLGLGDRVFPQAIALTEVRVRAGLQPLVADSRASGDARAHLDYLHQNDVVRYRQLTLEAHRQSPRKPGYSEAGARAGLIGILGSGTSLTEDVMAWFSSAYHGVKLLDPRLERVGIAREHEMSLVYPLLESMRLEEPLVQPPDGARQVPPNFSRGGEVPSPIPDRSLGAGTGFPLFVLLPRDSVMRPVTRFELHDSAGTAVRGYVSTPSKPANKAFPKNMNCAFFIPYTVLELGELYTATFEQEGMTESLRWSFKTWEWKPKKIK